jgi:hypothetical protein
VPGPLKYPKHEAFVRGLLENKTALDAYEAAGYARDDGNAARLSRNPRVQERLAELQAEIAAETTVTVQGLINELESARKTATDLKQLSAAIKAIEGKAKLSGLLVARQKVEITSNVFERMDEPREIALAVADNLLEFKIEPCHDFRDDDRERLADIWQQCFDALSEASEKLIEEIRSRPLRASYKPPKQLPPPNNGHRRY